MPPTAQRPVSPAAARPRALAPVLLVLLGLLALTGCGAGAVSQTASQASAVNGGTGQAGTVVMRDVVFEFPEPFVPDPTDGSVIYKIGGAAPMAATLVNTGGNTDRLLAVSSPIAAAGQVVGDGTLPAGSSVTIGNNTGAPSDALALRTIGIRLTGLSQPIRAGLTYPVTLRFEKAGAMTLRVPLGYPSGATAERK
jgi:periplasmic copper chaperone A